LGVGAVWVVVNFDILSEWKAEVSLEQTVKAYKVPDDATVLQVDVNLKNSSKRSVTYYCQRTEILELLPLTETNTKMVRDSVKPNTNFNYSPPQMKAIRALLNNGEGLIAPANGAAAARTCWSVSPYPRDYDASIADKSAKIKSVIVRNRFYEDSDCKPKLDRGENLIRNKEVTRSLIWRPIRPHH
jgi:hypothetical protein